LRQAAVQALREHRKRQAQDRQPAGALWQDHGLVFASAIGTPLDAANVRREFRKITEAAGPGVEWAPRDLRHTFVSLMSADGSATKLLGAGREQVTLVAALGLAAARRPSKGRLRWLRFPPSR
jgi:hypothetical protein